MDRFGWKLLAAVNAMLCAAKFSPALSAPNTVFCFEWVSITLGPIVALGLMGYGWRLGIGRRWIWKAVFFAQLFEWSVLLLLTVVAVGLSVWWRDCPFEDTWSGPLFVAVLGIELLKPYILFQYGFHDDATWPFECDAPMPHGS